MSGAVDVVVKIGGNLGREAALAQRLEPLRALRRENRVLLVPGGGVFADLVRAESARHGIAESAGHWMGVLAMEQYGHLLVDLLDDAALVRDAQEVAAALHRGALPVLAPYRWLRAEDPLPHAWAITSDSIAAWVAGRLGARRLILVKRSEVETEVDAAFESVVPAGLKWDVVVPGDGTWHPLARGAS